VDNLLKQFAQSSQLAGGNASYIEDLYEQYLVSPDSVDPKWKTYFDGFKGREAGDIPHSAVIAHITEAAKNAGNSATATGAGDERERNVGRLITAYRSRGHLGARLDPLGLTPPTNPPDLGLPFHSLSESDLGSEFSTGGIARPYQITAGPDGNLWYTGFRDRIGRMTPLGVVTEFSEGISGGPYLGGITAGPDGNLWFTEYESLPPGPGPGDHRRGADQLIQKHTCIVACRRGRPAANPSGQGVLRACPFASTRLSSAGLTAEVVSSAAPVLLPGSSASSSSG